MLILGVAYKADIGDVRESPGVKVMSYLDRRGAKVSFHDPYVPAVHVDGKFVERTDLNRRFVEGADCVAILTPHRLYDLDWVADHASLVFDARNAYGETRHANVVKL